MCFRCIFDEERQRIGSASLVDVLYTEKIAGKARVDKYGNVMKKYSEKYKEEDVTESVCT